MEVEVKEFNGLKWFDEAMARQLAAIYAVCDELPARCGAPLIQANRESR